MKTIKIAYNSILDNSQNSIMELSIDYPKYTNSRKCYLYELFYFEDLEFAINRHCEENFMYGLFNSELTPFFIKIKDETFKDLRKYLSSKTEYEEHKFNDDISLLTAMVEVYKKDPKNWGT